MPNLSSQSIQQPDSQIVYNTLYSQRLLEIKEENLNIPMNEYLSKLVNLNLKAVVDNNYIEYENNQEFINNIISQVMTNSNCLLDGFEVGVDSINNHIINIKVYPGTAILNNFLVELYETVVFSIDTSIDLNSNSYIIAIAPSNDDYSIKEFKILYYMLDENNIPIINESTNMEVWNNEKYLPIGLFTITGRSNDLRVLSLESLGVPIDLTDENNPPLFDIDESLKFQFIDIPYVDVIKNKTVLGTKSLTPLYVPPKQYIINNYNYIIPNYGEHINNGYFMFKKLYENDYFISNWIKSNILNFNKYMPNMF